MALRRQRLHSTGISNVDQRLREEWKQHRSLRPSLSESNHKLFQFQLGVKPVIPPAPDLAKTTANATQEQYYRSTGRPAKSHPQLTRIQTAPLKGMNLYVGGDNDPFIHMGKQKPPVAPGTQPTLDVKQQKKLPKYYRTKDVEHKQAIQETQLVHIQHKQTLEGRVDLDKVIDIRRTIRRRYANRSNFRLIFNQWDRDSLGVIRTEDLHFMVNQLGIPINMYEARVLVASANSTNSGTLNLDEFLQLVFDDSNKLNVDLREITMEAETSEKPVQAYSDVMLHNMHELAVNQHTKRIEKQLKMHIKGRLVDITGQMIRKDRTRSGIITFDKFCEVMSNLNLPHSISNQRLWGMLYEEAGGKHEGINYKDFMKSLESFEPEDDLVEPVQEEGTLPRNPLIRQKSESALGYTSKVEPKQLILDPQRVPVNKVESILERSRRICGFLREKFSLESDLKSALNSISDNGIITQAQLRSFVESATAGSYQITNGEMDHFLSRYIYNKHGQTAVTAVASSVFGDDVKVDTELQRRIRAIPPKEKPVEVLETTGEIRRVLQALDEKLFTQGVQKSYKAFKKFDEDNDGYVNYDDLKKGLKNLDIPYEESEAQQLMHILDMQNNGYVNYRDFARIIKPNTVYEHYAQFDQRPLSVQPNKAFLAAQLQRTETVDKAYEDLRQRYKPQSATISYRPSTRFGSTPQHKDTFETYVPPSDAGMYLDDKTRLVPKNLQPINLGNTDKEVKAGLQEAKSKRIRQTLTSYGQRIKEFDEKIEMLDEAKIGHKAAFREEYEKVRTR